MLCYSEITVITENINKVFKREILKMKKNRYIPIIAMGLITGVFSVLLVYLGNPKNMGFCIACFIRDMAGAMGMHNAAAVQYMRPEVIGLVLGAFVMSLIGKEFKPTGGSSPFTRFILGVFVTIGALMFLGCPLRMILRLGGGDVNAIFGLIGFTIGIGAGTFALNKGFSLKRSYNQGVVEGSLFSIANVIMLILVLIAPQIFIYSEKGPGSMHAPLWISLIAGLVLGALAQKTRLCMVGGIRDAILFKDYYLISGFAAIFVASLIGNLITNNFHLSMADQSVAHTSILWNILGMVLVGFASVLLGGCPMRQLILAGSGNSDSAVTVVGLLVGGALSHTLGLAASPAGPTFNGKIAVISGIVICAGIAYANIQKQKN